MIRRISVLIGLALMVGGVGSALAGTLYTTNLSGANEVPPNGSTATGHADLYLNSAETNLHVKVTVTGFTNTITASHIHLAPCGVNGGVIFSIGVFTTSIDADWALTATDVSNLKTGNLYVNVHSNIFPGGEIRGCIGLGSSSSWLAALSGANEVPPNGSTATAIGDVTLHGDGSILHIDLTETGFAPAEITASHIHKAPAGQNGGVIFSIGVFNDRISKDFNPTPAQIADLQNGDYYVNIHNGAFPGGAIRGQLMPDPTSGVSPVFAGNGLELWAGPNPMQETTTLRYSLPAGTVGQLEIFDAAGRRVSAIKVDAAVESVIWDGRDRAGSAVPNGIYYARLVSDRASETVRLAVVR